MIRARGMSATSRPEMSVPSGSPSRRFSFHPTRFRFWALTLLLCLGLISCKPNLLSLRQSNASYVLTTYRARPVAAANNGRSDLTLHDCRRISLANSLDVHTALWEERILGKQSRSSLVRMLPRVESRFDMSQRDRPAFSRSDVINQEGAFEVIGPGPGTGVTNFSSARMRGDRKWQVELKWSPMDAAMARYLARVKRNDATQARYQRVRVAQQLIGTVTAAFYRLLALQEALPKAQALERNRQSIVRDLKSLEKKGLVENREYIAARAMLSEASKRLSALYVDIGRQRALLASAMNVSPDSCARVGGVLYPLPPHCLDACKLEAIALVNRPEAFQADLTHLSSVDDYKRSLVKLFPRVEGFIGYFRDENKFILNNNYTEGGMRVTWDLMAFAADLLEQGTARDKVAKTERERALVSMGILTQVRIATLDAIKATAELKNASELAEQAAEKLRVARDVEEAKERGAPRRKIRISRQKALCGVLEAQVDRFVALGELHAELADLDAAVGANHSIAAAEVPSRRSSISPLPTRRPLSILSSAARLAESLMPW